MASAIPEWSDLVGKPFRLGGRGPDAYDCYGLVMEIGRRAGVNLPDLQSPEHLSEVASAIESGIDLWEPCEAHPGAIVTLRVCDPKRVSHVGVVLPFDQVLHAWAPAGGVCKEPLANWKRRILGYYRLAPKAA